MGDMPGQDEPEYVPNSIPESGRGTKRALDDYEGQLTRIPEEYIDQFEDDDGPFNGEAACDYDSTSMPG